MIKKLFSGNIPTIVVSGKTIPEVWEKSLIAVWQRGCLIKTQYDKPEDPPSRDCTMVMTIEDPLSEPRIHRGFPGGLEDLEIYRQEVLLGVHDHWVDINDSVKWDYTYHQRLCKYEGIKKEKLEIGYFDQIRWAIENLAETPYTRRILAITWEVEKDQKVNDPPCLQQCWWRILEGENGLFLNMRTLWRSRDAFKAAFMNIFALTELQRMMAEEISKICGKKINVGQYTDVSWSYHIYGSYFQEFEGFLEALKKRSFKERTWTSKFVEPFFELGRQKLEQQLRAEAEGRGKGVI